MQAKHGGAAESLHSGGIGKGWMLGQPGAASVGVRPGALGSVRGGWSEGLQCIIIYVHVVTLDFTREL